MRFDPPLEPPVPPLVMTAAKLGKLVIFVGAGVSALVGSPDWDALATGALRQLCGAGCLDYAELELLNRLDPKKRLSIAKDISSSSNKQVDYRQLIEPEKPDEDGLQVFADLLSVGTVFVTTNYDSWFEKASLSVKENTSVASSTDQARSILTKSSIKSIYSGSDLLSRFLYEPGYVIHLHGSLDDPNSMVISTRDYLTHYARDNVKDFLEVLFQEFTVLFAGYGIEEIEILEYVFRKNPIQGNDNSVAKHYWLFPVFSHEESLFFHLQNYYRNQCNVELVPYNRDKNNYLQLASVIRSWVKEISVRPPAFIEKSTLIERAFNG